MSGPELAARCRRGHGSGASPRDVILVGGSAGGIEAVTLLLGQIDDRIPAAICVTLHRGAQAGHLAGVLRRHSQLKVADARDGERLARGRVFVAPSDRHMLFEGNTIRLDRGPKEHHTRPAIDAMFRSGAASFGRRVIAVLLTGNLDDGVAGLIEVQEHDGLSIVQDPDEAEFPSMPESAIRFDVDVISRLEAMPRLLARLASGESVAQAVLAAQGGPPPRGGSPFREPAALCREADHVRPAL